MKPLKHERVYKEEDTQPPMTEQDALLRGMYELLLSQRETNIKLTNIIEERRIEDRGAGQLHPERYLRRERETQGPRPMTIPKGLSFDGSSELPWNHFILKFNSYCRSQGYRNEEKLDALMWCLTGKASTFYMALLERYPHLNFYQVETELKERFDQGGGPENLMAQFMSETQSPNEELRDWADRVLSLAYRALKDLPDDQAMSMAVTRFCQGCSDKQAGQAIITGIQRPASVSAAVRAIEWYQLNRNVIFGQHKSSASVRAVEQEVEPVVQAVTNAASRGRGYYKPDPVRRPEPNFHKLESKLDTVIDLLHGFIKKSGEKNTTFEEPRSKTGCHYCGAEGHFARECPRKRVISKGRQVSAITTEETESEVSLNYQGSEDEA
jgi:hypothetical protein